jgi:hypothetical protein
VDEGGPMSANELPDRGALLRMTNGFQVSGAIHVAATLGIADLLVDGPRDVDELAVAAESHAPTLYRLLRAVQRRRVRRGGRRPLRPDAARGVPPVGRSRIVACLGDTDRANVRVDELGASDARRQDRRARLPKGLRDDRV